MMAKKINLGYDFDEEYSAIEVLSPLMDYEFAWMINKEMGVKFRREKNFKVFNEKDAYLSEYVLFTWKRLEKVTYFLSHPCNTTDLLMPVYYFFIQGNEKDETISAFVDKLHNLPDIVSVECIHIGDIDELPEKNQIPAFKNRIAKIHNILFDLEDHLREMKQLKKMQMNKKHEDD